MTGVKASDLARWEREARAEGVICSPLTDCIAEIRALHTQLARAVELLTVWERRAHMRAYADPEGALDDTRRFLAEMKRGGE